MSEYVGEFNSKISINSHDITVKTTIGREYKDVTYQLTCSKEMAPGVVAATLYLMVCDICERLQLDIDDLVNGLIEFENELH